MKASTVEIKADRFYVRLWFKNLLHQIARFSLIINTYFDPVAGVSLRNGQRNVCGAVWCALCEVPLRCALTLFSIRPEGDGARRVLG